MLDKKVVPQTLVLLSAFEKQVVCEFRRVAKLPLDDVYLSLRDQIKTLTRSNLDRCLKRSWTQSVAATHEANDT